MRAGRWPPDRKQVWNVNLSGRRLVIQPIRIAEEVFEVGQVPTAADRDRPVRYRHARTAEHGLDPIDQFLAADRCVFAVELSLRSARRAAPRRCANRDRLARGQAEEQLS